MTHLRITGLLAALTFSGAGLTFSGGCAVEEEADEIGAVTYAVCCGSNCCCNNGGRQDRGDRNPSNECEMCDPSNDPMVWTAVPNCTPGGGDTGTPRPDASTGGGGDDGGCSVGAVGGTNGAAWGVGLLGLLGLLAVRRRR